MKPDPDMAAPETPLSSSPENQRMSWESVVDRAWRKMAMTFVAALSLASFAWQVTHRNLIFDFVFHPDRVARPEHAQARHTLVRLALLAGLAAATRCAFIARQVRLGRHVGDLHREFLLSALLPLPLIVVPAIEFQHPWFTAGIVALFGLALAWAVFRESRRLPTLRDLTHREAHVLVAAAVAVFVASIGFLSHWRFITFHSQLCDSSWETNSVWGIIKRGIPTTSVAAWMYDGKPLPAPYFNDHVPLADYLYAPFFALYPDPRTLLWLQAAFMGLGAIGAYLIGRRWLDSRFGGVLAAWVYVLNPSVQSFCLHDLHPNILVIPSLMLAVGLMETKRPWAALGFAILAAACHEETPIYAAGLGLYWMLSGGDRLRFRLGLGICVFSLGLAVFFSAFLMPHFGGQPHWSHFNFFFDDRPSAGSMVSALVLNPVAAALKITSDLKLDYLAISLAPVGGLALLGWKAGWFALPAVLLLVPSESPGFFCPGMNYSAPLVPAILLMGLAGIRRFWQQNSGLVRERRLGLAAYVLSCALLGNYLYGNIAAKSFKMEYGFSPLRRQNQYNYRDMLGYVDALPPYGPVEQGLWEVIRRVPAGAPVLTSWAINPQLANRDISLAFGYSRGNPAPEDRVDFVVIDKLPAMQVPTEPEIARFRKDPRFRLFYENSSGVIFARRRD